MSNRSSCNLHLNLNVQYIIPARLCLPVQKTKFVMLSSNKECFQMQDRYKMPCECIKNS